MRVSKLARMGIDDSGLNALRPPTHDELLPLEHSFDRIPSLIAHADLAVFLRVESEGWIIGLKSLLHGFEHMLVFPSRNAP